MMGVGDMPNGNIAIRDQADEVSARVIADDRHDADRADYSGPS
jgi:hypothetical protein